MSQKCPRHFLQMGTCPKILLTELDGQPYFCRIWSVTCPLRVLRVNHVSNTLKNKKKRTQINQIFQICIWMINLFPLQYFFWNSSFAVTKQLLIPKWKKEVSTKDLLCEHKKCVAKHTWSLSSLAPLLIPDKNHFFHFFMLIWNLSS